MCTRILSTSQRAGEVGNLMTLFLLYSSFISFPLHDELSESPPGTCSSIVDVWTASPIPLHPRSLLAAGRSVGQTVFPPKEEALPELGPWACIHRFPHVYTYVHHLFPFLFLCLPLPTCSSRAHACRSVSAQMLENNKMSRWVGCRV